MDPLSALVRGIIFLLLAFLVPKGLMPLFRWVFEAERGGSPALPSLALFAALPFVLAFGALLGAHAVPPPWAHAPLDPSAVAAGVAFGLVAVVGGVGPRALSKSASAFSVPLAKRRGAAVAMGVLAGGALPGILLTVALILGRPPQDLTPESVGNLETTLWLRPYDPRAHLGLGTLAARNGAVTEARFHLDAAKRAGADLIAALELESEIHAARRDCDAARAAYDRALRLRTERALAHVLEERLVVGGYRLPALLVQRCGLRASPGGEEAREIDRTGPSEARELDGKGPNEAREIDRTGPSEARELDGKGPNEARELHPPINDP